MESEDYAFYQGLVYLMDNNVEHLGYDLTFSTEVNWFFCTMTNVLHLRDFYIKNMLRCMIFYIPYLCVLCMPLFVFIH